MRIDFHTHTTCSDGQYTPEELVQKAAAAGICALAITDHDAVSGIARGKQAAKHFRSCKFSPALKSVQKKIRSCIFWATALMAKTQICKPISLATARSGRADGNGCWHFWRKKVFPLPSKKWLLPTTAAPQADRILQKPCF